MPAEPEGDNPQGWRRGRMTGGQLNTDVAASEVVSWDAEDVSAADDEVAGADEDDGAEETDRKSVV